MRINAHCHVFNLQAVFTQGTKNILQNRIRTLPPPFPDLILWLLEAHMAGGRPAGLRPDAADPLTLLATAVEEAGGGDLPLPALLLARMKSKTSISDGVLSLFDKAACDAALCDLIDLAAFVNIALTPDIDAITDFLFDQMAKASDEPGASFAIAPLMMDILSPAPDQAELALFEKQRAATSRQILRYPGRVLPFVAANPARPDMVATVKTALEDHGFVGVKLYPSLGYRVDDGSLDGLFALCNEKRVPLTMHCNTGGFYADRNFIDHCSPEPWGKILRDYPDIRICFAHFGGERFFLPSPDNTQAVWNAVILDMMRQKTIGSRVFADISYNTGGMGAKWARKGYFGRLNELLAEETVGSQILWGTDYFLVRQRISEEHYWQYFRDRITSDGAFDAATRHNPARFLGLPAGGAALSPVMADHLRFLADHARDAGIARRLPPAEWTKGHSLPPVGHS